VGSGLALYIPRMAGARLLFVTGKGGVGKTTIAAALGAHAAREGVRVLIVELGGDRSLVSLFGKHSLGTEPTTLAARLSAVRVEQRALVESYFTRLLRLSFLSRRLFASATFNAITAAAPGVAEFLVLEHLLQWLEGGVLTRSKYDLVIVDGPASGHALRLLRTPRTIATMVAAGPIGSGARTLLGLLADHQRTQVLLVTIADEMAVNETLEAHTALIDDLAMRVTRPVLNRVFPRRFTRDDTAAIASLARRHADDPLLRAARIQIAARHDAERHLSRLRRAFGMLPISVRQVCGERVERPDLDRIGRTLADALLTKG
jgi:anion-transporting  ArsA/GET3 family ATPase